MLSAQQERCISRAIMQKFNFRTLTPEEQGDLWQGIQRELQQNQLPGAEIRGLWERLGTSAINKWVAICGNIIIYG